MIPQVRQPRTSFTCPMLKEGHNMNIYVGNLPLEVTEEELRQTFITFGEVLSVIIMNDKYIGSGQPRGYGYIQMPSRSEAQAAVLSLEGKSLRGQLIKVVEALPLSDIGLGKNPERQRGKFAGMKTRQRQN
jgi:RNA recognition motif-containing protein